MSETLLPETVLIVEDDPGVAQLQRRRLEREGYAIESASNAAAALERIRRGGIDLVVMDYRLPDNITGLGFYTQCKAAGYNVPAILVTGFSDEAVVVEALRDGVRDFVSKTSQYLDYLPHSVERVIKQVRTERQLAESQARLAAIIDSVSDAVLTVDERQRITLFNPAAERMFGCPADQALGHPLRKFLPGVGSDATAADAASGDLADLAERIRGQTTGRRTDGEEFPLEASASPGELSPTPFLTVLARDVTERQRAEQALRERDERLRQAQKMEVVGRLAGGVAHEFNNLLQVIMGYGSCAAAGLAEDDPRHGDVQEVLKAASHAASLTRQLLAFGRRQPLERTVVDVRSLLDDASRMLRPLIGEHIASVLTVDPELRPVRGDAAMLQQVLLNLCLNARDSMPEGGRMTIEADNYSPDADDRQQHDLSAGDYVRIQVSDDGVGIEPENLGRIFEPFYTTKPQGQGTGLGLATVLGIVEEHHGAVDVESVFGIGTRFTVLLPATSEEADLPRRKGRRIRGGSETVLVAEDEPQIRTYIARVLKAAGYTVLTAGDGEQAVKIFQRHADDVDLVLLDQLMPRLLGQRALEAIRSLRPELPAAFLSGCESRGSECPEAAFLQKPIGREELLEAVRRLLDAAPATIGSAAP